MDTAAGHRRQLLDGLQRFVQAVGPMAGVRRIAALGSIVTDKADPKDVDVLVVGARLSRARRGSSRNVMRHRW